jgi:hypothetical protein
MYTNLPPPLDGQMQMAVSLLGYIASLVGTISVKAVKRKKCFGKLILDHNIYMYIKWKIPWSTPKKIKEVIFYTLKSAAKCSLVILLTLVTHTAQAEGTKFSVLITQYFLHSTFILSFDVS